MHSFISQTNRKNLFQLILLRIHAIFGQAFAILFVNYFLKIQLPLTEMFTVIGFLILVNCFSFYRFKTNKKVSDKSLFFELLIDVFTLALQLYLSGGISNPFISLFLLQVVISVILLRFKYAIITTIITIFSYAFLSFKYRHIHELHNHGNNGNFLNLHLQGMFITYIIAAILLLIFIHKIIKNLNERDKRIHLLKQQALEKEQILQMGLLATGAAHELGTPLSTISVVLGDLKDATKEFEEDFSMIEKQVSRCKKIISEILASSKSQRVEKAEISTIKQVFDNLIFEWKESRNPQNLIYNFIGDDQQRIIFDDILAQAFFNIFDNALEVSPKFVSIEVNVADNLTIIVQDHGEGFHNDVLQRIGETNLSTKNSNGIGLFLAINALNKVNGKLEVSNLEDGAEVKIIIPLESYE